MGSAHRHTRMDTIYRRCAGAQRTAEIGIKMAPLPSLVLHSSPRTKRETPIPYSKESLCDANSGVVTGIIRRWYVKGGGGDERGIPRRDVHERGESTSGQVGRASMIVSPGDR